MSRFVEIDPRPVEVLGHVGKFTAAAASLAVRNSVFLIPRQVESAAGTITGEQRLDVMLSVLNKARPTWDVIRHQARHITPNQDIHMHGNPYEPYMMSPDYLHYHHTPHGTVVATFAQARSGYLDESAHAKPILTEALREGKTDVRYADPTTFLRAFIEPGDALIFRLNEEASQLPLLHDFQTTSEARVAEITAVYRLD